MPVHDREVVAAIVSGDADGLAAAFDQYAPGLYAYCRSQLTESADAADAIQDTFIIASSGVSGLSEPDRLRAWLYAVARNECQRRLRAAGPTAALYESAEAMDDTGTLTAVTEQTELRAQVRAALAALNPVERDVIELNLRQQLSGSDLGDVLGVTRAHAQALAATARSQFERSLGVSTVALFEWEYCPHLAAILHGRGGKRTALRRRRVKRHIGHCGVCGGRDYRDLSPAMVLSLLRVPALPAGLRRQALDLAVDASPGTVAYRDQVMQRAAPLGPGGFPVQLTTRSAPRWRGTPVMAAAAAAAALALLGGGMYYVNYVSSHTAAAPVAVARTPTPGSTGSGHTAKPAGNLPSVPAPLRARVFPPSTLSPATPPVTAPLAGTTSPGHAASPAHSSPVQTSPAPVQTSPAPVQTSPAPVQTSPAPVQTSPAPVQTSPAPVQTSPAPVQTSPAPVQTSPAPVQTSPAPVQTSPAPVQTTPASADPSPTTSGLSPALGPLS